MSFRDYIFDIYDIDIGTASVFIKGRLIMEKFKCPKCGSVDVFAEKSGNHTGLYCGSCGKWIKWLTKAEIRLLNRQKK